MERLSVTHPIATCVYAAYILQADVSADKDKNLNYKKTFLHLSAIIIDLSFEYAFSRILLVTV